MLLSTIRYIAPALVAVVLHIESTAAINFTIHNGQIFTPGPAVLDAPQPGTPLGGREFSIKSHSLFIHPVIEAGPICLTIFT